MNRKCLCVLSTMLDTTCIEIKRALLIRHKILKTYTLRCKPVKDNIILRVKKFTKQETVTKGKVKKKKCVLRSSKKMCKKMTFKLELEASGRLS